MDKEKAKTSISLGILFNYLRIAIFLIISLFYPPFLLSYVHKVDNGILTLAVSLLQVISLLSFGVENSYVRFATKKEKEGEGALSKINGSYLILFSLVSIVIFACGVCFALLYRFDVLKIQGADSPSLIFWVILITSISTAFDFFLSLFMWFEIYRSRFVLHQLALIAAKILTVSFAMLSLVLGEGILWVSLVTLIVQLSYGIFNVIYSLKKLKMSISFAPIKEIRGDLLEIFRFSIFIFLTMAVSQIENNSGKIILSNTLGASSVTVFSYGLQFYTYAALLSKGVSDTCSPKINSLCINGEAEETNKIFLKASFLEMSVLALLIGGFALAGRDFLLAWLGDKELTDAELLQIYIIALASLIVWFVPLTENVSIEMERAKNKHKMPSLVNFILALLSVPLSIVLTLYLPDEWRIYGPLIGSSLFVVLGFYVFNNVYCKKVLKMPIGKYFLILAIIVIIAAISFVIPFAIFEYVLPLDSLDSWLSLIVKAASFLIIYAGLYLSIFHKTLFKKRS